MKTLKQSLIIAGLAISVFASCRKDKFDSDTSASKNENQAESYFNELNSISDQVAENGELSGYKLSEDQGVLLSTCALITIDTSSQVSLANPDTFIVDFGTGCSGTDGKVRSGKIIISASGRYRDAGTVIRITTDNYFVNGNQVLGYRLVTNTGLNDLGQPTFSVEVNGSIILANNAGTIEWVANRVRTWIAGNTTPLLFFDDVYSLSGSSNGTRVNGVSWSSTITSPLIYKHSCREFVEGTIELEPDNKPLRTIDFGTGSCDGTASVNINGNTYIISFL